MEYYIAQILIFLFAIPSSVEEEKAFTFPFREFPWPSGYNKAYYLKRAHFFGAMGVLFVLLGFSILIACDYPLWWPFLFYFFITLFTTGLIYWQAFDSGFGVSINKGLFYLGESPSTDAWWKKTFGDKAGMVKFFAFITAIVILNILYLMRHSIFHL